MSAVLRLLFVLVVVIVSNASAQEADSVVSIDNIVDALKLKKKGVLPFGIKPGATMGELKAGAGGSEIFKDDSTYITYTIYFSNDKYDFADISFELPTGVVSEASIETYFGDKERATKALNNIKMNFDKLYKVGEYAARTLKWKYSKKGVTLWIQLNEIEFEGDNGFVIDFFTTDPDNQ